MSDDRPTVDTQTDDLTRRELLRRAGTGAAVLVAGGAAAVKAAGAQLKRRVHGVP